MGAQEASGSRRLLLAMALASGITSVPNAAIVLALPTIHRQFDASLTELEWTVTGYLLAYSALLIAAGRLADVFGRVRLLQWGTVLYALASIPAALAGSATVLIVGLVAVGIGAAVLTPASLAIVTDRFRGERRGTAVGAWGAATALFSGIGPAIGGVFTQEISWRWILWLNVIVGVLILIGVRGTTESYDPEASRRIDWTGLAMSAAGLGAITLALNEAPTPWAVGSPVFLIVLIGGVLLLAAFVLVERRVRDSLIDLAMFRRRNVTGASIIVFVLDFAFGAVLFFVPLFLQEQLGDDALKAGLLLLPASVTMMLAMPIGGRLFEKVGTDPPDRRRHGARRAGHAAPGRDLDLDAVRGVVAPTGAARARHRHRVDADESRRPRRDAAAQPWRRRRDHHHARGARGDVRRRPVRRGVRDAADEPDRGGSERPRRRAEPQCGSRA